MAARLFRRLQGLFCVYKPPGVHWKLVRDTVENNLLQDLNASSSARPVPREVRYLLSQSSTEDDPKALTLSAASVPILSEHPLVTGPDFQRIRVGVGHRLDAFSSGVLVLGVGHANKALNDLYNSRVTRDYTVEGAFGAATNDFASQGRVIERSTYDHITRDKLEKVLAMLQGANQKALLMYSRVDMRSQEAYEMAVRGQLGPEDKSVPILLGLRCIRFEPPNFTLEVQALNETQKYLRKVVHEIGLELRSTAVCKSIRRTRDGSFTVHHALTRNQWTTKEVMNAIQQYHAIKKRTKSIREQNEDPELHLEEGDINTSQNSTDRIDTLN
ncbi:pseudouridylate synthase TRUB2, mitochondrial [Eucyclogobius newberryi]|uniref:pseudouridylate synthase TRUB2, mitochondrial n=1 Tax=Eucyclogobius newberryi TaxID=166745 RepID=UPI003B5A2EAC